MELNPTLYFLCALILCLVLTVAAARYVIPILKSKKMGQPILEIGPRWHKSKEGTPTMGGVTFIFAVLVPPPAWPRLPGGRVD